MLCSSPMSIMMFWNTPVFDLSLTGIDRPHCSIYCISPTVFRHTDFPPALGPEMIRMRLAPVSVISNGTIFLSCFSSDLCSSGCRASIQSISGFGSTFGSMAFICFAISARARTLSICPMNTYERSISFTWGLMMAVMSVSILIISLRSSASSSLTLLFASTTSAGSTNTVLPVADSSCTMPFIFFFSAGAIGITRRPSRMVGATSFSTSPSLCAALSMLLRVLEMLPSVRASSCLIVKRWSEALSFMRPNLSSILSVWRMMSGKVITSSVIRAKAG